MQDKLLQKSKGSMTEEATLIKMFKFFDWSDRGAVDYTQFVRVLEKTGLYYPTDQL